MDQRPVSGSWKLASPHDKMTQGLVISGFSSVPTGRALFLELGWKGVREKGGGDWLGALQAIAPITDADGRDEKPAAIAFTYDGLRKMGLNANTLASFDRPFREGMFQEDRLRRLGDRRGDAWEATVIPGGPLWSGNTPVDAAAQDTEIRAFDRIGAHPTESQIATPTTVHALLLLYAADDEAASAWCQQVEAVLAGFNVRVSHSLPLDLRLDARGVAREHFGFADGISQPIPYQAGTVVYNNRSDVPQDPWNGVPLGEILIGHKNSHNEVSLGPVVPTDSVADAANLPVHPTAEGFSDFGLDGSYLVARELKQDVVAFWDAMRAGAKRIRESDPDHSEHVTTTWLAERVVGRDTKGNLLCPGGVLPTVDDDQPDNDFGFFDTDRLGHGCPLGSHVRRANPRDGLAPTAKDKQTLLDAANSHRILRRGRKFGKKVSIPPKEDGENRGLLFIALNTDIARQFEFVQQTWVLNSNFASLYDETDPLIGPKGTMTIPEDPLRRIIDVETFVQMAGGEYFFLPSIPAIRYLAAL